MPHPEFDGQNMKNPGGRPKGHGISWFLARLGDERLPDGKTRKEHIAKRLLDIALDPSTTNRDFLTICAEMMDRLEGKAVNTNINAEVTASPLADIDTATLEAFRARLAEIKATPKP